MDAFTNMPPALAFVLMLFLLGWLILLFLTPFMVEGVRSWSRKNHQELKEINKRLDRLNALLAGRLGTEPRQPAPLAAAEDRKARKEPIISDYTPAPGAPERRSPPRPKSG